MAGAINECPLTGVLHLRELPVSWVSNVQLNLSNADTPGVKETVHLGEVYAYGMGGQIYGFVRGSRGERSTIQKSLIF